MEIPSDRQFLSVSELLASGLSHYRINKMVAAGKLIKRTNKIYENTAYNGIVSDFATVFAFAPKGVVCMMTAARCHGLTTYLPDSIDIAIDRSMKISTLPDWPSVNIWYFPKTRYERGVTSFSDESGCYHIYDPEKTVVDILYYRNKIGIDDTKAVLKNYLDRENRDLVALHRYAEYLGCGKVLSTYLEVLL